MFGPVRNRHCLGKFESSKFYVRNAAVKTVQCESSSQHDLIFFSIIQTVRSHEIYLVQTKKLKDSITMYLTRNYKHGSFLCY